MLCKPGFSAEFQVRLFASSTLENEAELITEQT